MIRDWRFLSLMLLSLIGALVGGGRLFELTCEARDDARFPMPGKLVSVDGARKLHLLCTGAGDGPTVVMVAGGGTPAVASYRLQAAISHIAHVCSYDRPGLGWSPSAATPLTFDEHVRDLESMLHNGGVPGPYLFAPESFGALIVLGYARQHPDETAGIAFLDGVDPTLWFSAMREQGDWRADAKNGLIAAAERLGVARLAFSALAPTWVKALPLPIQRQMRAIYSRPSPGFDEALQAWRRSAPDQRPTLTPGMLGYKPVIAVQHGKTSGALSSAFQSGWAASQRRLAEASRNGRMTIAEGADHEVAQEAPDFAAAQVEAAVEAARARR